MEVVILCFLNSLYGKNRVLFKIISFLLIITFVLTALCGCQGKAVSSDPTDDGISSNLLEIEQTDTSSEQTDASSEQTDASSEEEKLQYTYEEVLDENPSYPNNPADRIETVSKLSELKTSEIGFGYYGLTPAEDTAFSNYQSHRTAVQSDYVNTCLVSTSRSGDSIRVNIKTLEFMRENNCKAWIGVYDIFRIAGNEGWEDLFDSFVKYLKDNDVYDVVLGWYLDEPTNHERVRTITKYAKEKYNKRFLICYLASSVAPGYQAIGIYDSVGISKRTTEYLTDIAYDLYWDVNTSRYIYEEVTRRMLSNLGNPDTKIWFIPYVAIWGGSFQKDNPDYAADNKFGIQHLNTMYEFLKQQENPGGLLCYAYTIGNTSFENQFGWKQANDLNNGAYDPIFARSIEIGREICTGKSGLDDKIK